MRRAGTRPRAQAAQAATSAVFALNGIAFATWVSRIPDARTSLGLQPGQLGLLLLVGSAGSVLGLPLAGLVASRLGTRVTVVLGAALCLGGIAGAGLAIGVLQSTLLAAAALFVSTFGMGQWDVAMNLEGADVERELGRTVMPLFHAAFSLGSVVAAVAGAGLIALGIPIEIHLPAVGALVAAAVVLASGSFLPSGAAGPAGPPPPGSTSAAGPAQTAPGGSCAPARPAAATSAWGEPRTLLIGLVTLVAAFTEGTANDWMSVAFIDGYGLPEWAGVLGFATFVTFMTLGRLTGPWLLDRYGRVPLMRVLLVVAAAGSLLVVFGTPVLAYVGAAVWGFGISLGFPVGMSAGADDPRRAAARVSVISTIAYGAFLFGPPALGFLGDHWGVLRALSVVSMLLVVAFVALPAVREGRR